MHLGRTGGGHRDTGHVPAGIARFGLNHWLVIVVGDGVVVGTRAFGALVVVHRRPMVMLRMIVAGVLVHVRLRCHRGRKDQGAGEHAGGEATHLGSLLRPCMSHWKQRREPL